MSLIVTVTFKGAVRVNQSEQIARLTRIVARMSTGGEQATAARALASAGRADRGRVAKRAGISTGQLEEWLHGRLELPVDQTLQLLSLAQEAPAR